MYVLLIYDNKGEGKYDILSNKMAWSSEWFSLLMEREVLFPKTNVEFGETQQEMKLKRKVGYRL